MKSITIALALVLSAGAVLAQSPRTVYFSPRFTESPVSGRGGYAAPPMQLTAPPCGGAFTPGTIFAHETAICNSEGLAYVEPGVINATVPFSGPPAVTTTDFIEISNFPVHDILFGDANNNGIPAESISGGGTSTNFSIDEIFIPAPAVGHRNNIHEIFVSPFNDTVGAFGFYGTVITSADMVLLPAAANVYPAPSVPATPVFFVRKTDWTTFLNVPAASRLNLDAFARDAVTGDIYASFDGRTTTDFNAVTSTATNLPVPVTVTTTPLGVPTTVNLVAGDIIRIPAAAYTPSGPYGAVSSPIGGMAQLVYTAADVTAMVANAGGTLSGVSYINAYALCVDDQSSTTVTPAGFTVATLFFTVDNRGGGAAVTAPVATQAPAASQNFTASAIYTTAGGVFATINGVTMSNPNALGVRNQSFSSTFYAGPPDAIAVVTHTPTLDPFLDKPLHLDSFPTRGLLSGSNAALYTGVIKTYISGGRPTGAIPPLTPVPTIYVFARLDVIPTGSFLDRYNVSPFVSGFPELYVDMFGAANASCVIAPAVPPFDLACQNPAAQSILNAGVNPLPLWYDFTNSTENGDACFDLNLTTVVPPLSPPFSPPIVITFQALEIPGLRLSTPISYQLN